MPDATPFLQFDSVTKTYVGVTALQGVSFGVREGTVHALMGENGAGKSTLLKALSGAHRPTAGTIRLGGAPREFASTAAALAAGVAVIYQELHLVAEMTVAENIFLGHLPQRRGLIDRATLREKTRALLQRLGEDIDPDARLARLPIGQRQMVEIAKALSRGAKVIAFDEPTSSLSVREIERLFAVIRELRAQGCVILYVTHRMEEVFALADACTVLRDGRHVRTYESLREVTPAQLVQDMVGRDIADVYAYTPRPLGAVALELDGLAGPGVRAPVTLSVAQGEILGLFGLVGAGRTELLKLLFGAERATAGRVAVHGAPLVLRSPADAIAAGVVYCTEDRKREGIVPILSVQDNCNLGIRAPHTRWGGLIDARWERENAAAKVQELAVRTPSVGQLIKHLSGGNQQKVILARWLSTKIRVLLLDEPTRGIDVGAKSEIYRIILRLAAEGVAVILVSSDLPEALGLADRVAVLAKPLRIGFAQTGAESAWRTANSESMKAEAAKRGIELKFSDAQGKQENQIRAVRSFITQGVDAIVIAPIVETGWDPVLREAKRAKIPVILTDRTIATADESLFACFIGSDFYEEGRMAADWLAKHTGGKGTIVELQGTPGSAPANERRKAFADALKGHPDLRIIDSQSGNFERSGGKQVMEAFLKKHGSAIQIVYAHNDDMALGAAQAIEEAGLKPGKDLVIVSIDAIREAVKAVADGRLNCTVECNPLFGPKVYDTVAKILAGATVPKKSFNKDELFDATNAAAALPTRQY